MGFDSQFTHHIPVRYGELDQQGVVFNAHYLAFIDDAFEQWTHTFETDVRALGWDMMLKKLDMEWHSPAGYRDVIQFDCAITRWGGASFEITLCRHRRRASDRNGGRALRQRESG